MAIAGAVYVRIVSQYSDKGSKAAQKDIQRTAKKIDQFAKKIAKSFAIGAAAASAFALKIGIDAVKGAAEDQKAQTSLAIAIRNTTSATEEAITANTKFLDTLELQVAIDNNELIPALQKLVTATGDLSQAQNLLILSTDIAAASGKDLSIVSAAVARAMGGNFTALTKLGLPIDKVALKQGNLNKILDDFADISKGQASAAANTYAGRLKVLALSYNQVLDKLGLALMPYVIEFTDYLTKPGGLLDSLDEWIEKNETELQESLKGVSDIFKLIIDNGDNVTKVLGALVQISGFLNSSVLGIIKWGEALILAFGTGYLFRFFKKNFGGVNKEVLQGGKRFDAVSEKATNLTDKTAKIGKGFDTTKTTKSVGVIRSVFGALSTRVKVVLGLMAAVGSGNLFSKIKDFFAGANDAELLKQMQAQTKIDFQNEQATKEQDRLNKIVYDNSVKYQTDLDRQRIIDAAKRAAEVKKQEELEAKILKRQTALRKSLGIKGSNQIDAEKDLVQLNAAEALLKRQEKNNEIDKERIKALKEELISLKVRNDLAERYNDILKALADNEISNKDIIALAGKWGVTTEAVKAYLATIFAVEDGTISDEEVIELAKSWGSTQAQAAQYLDFFVALNDGVLSDAEIEKLKGKWKLTEDQVRMYADFVGIVNDGKLTDAEIVKIQGKWKLTTDQVVDYIKQIGSPVSYSGTLIDPARAAEIAWKDATAALAAYLALLGKANSTTVTTTPSTTTTTPSGTVNTTTIEGINKASGYTDSSIAAANAYAVAKAAGDATGAALAAAGVNPSTLASAESGAIGAASIAAQLKAAEIAVANSATLAQFQAKEAADLAASVAKINNSNYDEGFRFRAFSPTMNTASGGGFQNSMAGNTTVNVTVQGSVTSEQDLVTTIRNGLLSQQYNGDSITLQAV